MRMLLLMAVYGLSPVASWAADFQAMMVRGSVELGGELVIQVQGDGKPLPEGAHCRIELPARYAAHVTTVSDDCAAFTLHQATVPIRDDAGYAIPSAQVPYSLIVEAPDGSEVGRVGGIFPYNNQFSDLRILIDGVRNPVAPGQSFHATVLGAGQPIDASLTCRWNTYGPVRFEPTSDNHCEGTLTATAAGGGDADMDVEIVNMIDMHAVGYALARMIVE